MEQSLADATIVFFGMSVVMSFLAMIIIAISVAYYRLSKSAHREREEFIKRQEAAKLDEQAILKEAHLKAQKILVDAQTSAQQMVQSSDIFSQEYKTEFRAKLLQVIQKEEQQFQEMYNTIKSQSSNVISTISKDINAHLSSEMQALTQSVQTEVAKSIEEYKKASYARIQEQVSQVVNVIASKVLKKSISQDEHKQLVLEALEEAKEHNVL